MSSGGGQSGVTRYDWNPVMEQYWAGNADTPGGTLLRGQQESFRPYQQYQYQRVADLSPDQSTALNMTRNVAVGGTNLSNTAREQSRATLAGDYLNNNPYAGNSPYFNQMLQAGLEDITNAYKQGTAADTTRMFNLSGAFGGSAHQNAVGQNEAALGKTLGNYTSGMQNDQFNRSAGMYGDERNRMMSALGGGLGNDQAAIGMYGQLMNMGGTARDVTQRGLDTAYNDWTTAQNWNRNNLDWLANFLGRAQGSTGVTSTSSPYGGNNYLSQGIGAGLLGRSLGVW